MLGRKISWNGDTAPKPTPRALTHKPPTPSALDLTQCTSLRLVFHPVPLLVAVPSDLYCLVSTSTMCRWTFGRDMVICGRWRCDPGTTAAVGTALSRSYWAGTEAGYCCSEGPLHSHKDRHTQRFSDQQEWIECMGNQQYPQADDCPRCIGTVCCMTPTAAPPHRCHDETDVMDTW